MYLAIDIGGTKILIAALDDGGVITEQAKIPTPKNYPDFLSELNKVVDNFTTREFTAIGVGIAGRIDRKTGHRFASGRLAWDNVPIQSDIESSFKTPTVVENDAKLAGLSEAMLLRELYQRVLYVTVSTGIGYALVVNQVIDANIGDDGGNTIMLARGGKRVSWESFAAGSAIVRRYDKMAQDIHDAPTWQKIAHDISLGLIELIAITEPEAIVFGGSVGNYFNCFEAPLAVELSKNETPLLKMPKLLEAKRPDEAVIYGCYDLAKQTYGNASKTT